MASFDPKNVSASPDVAVRAAAREDLDHLRRWGWHREPYLAEYNIPLLSDADLDSLWITLTARPGQLLYHGLLDDRLVAQIKLRDIGTPPGSAELGIMMDASEVGRGLGKAIITRVLALAFEELGLDVVRLEVAGYNARAIAAYAACGFRETSRQWVQLDSRVDFAGLLKSPEHAWLSEWVRVDAGITRVVILAMEARK